MLSLYTIFIVSPTNYPFKKNIQPQIPYEADIIILSVNLRHMLLIKPQTKNISILSINQTMNGLNNDIFISDLWVFFSDALDDF